MDHTIKLECGMVELLWHALLEHQRLHFGDKPRCFELHPSLKPLLIEEALAKEKTMSWSLMWQLAPRDPTEQPRLFNIPITWTTQAVTPRIITSNNTVEWL